MDTNEQKYFKPAELVIPSPSAKDQRWYIKFYCYDVQRQEIVRKRFYNIPEGNSISHRNYLAQRICAEINKRLIEGKVIDRYGSFIEKQKTTNSLSILTDKVSTDTVLSKVFQLKQFNEIRTMQTYSSIVENLCRYIRQESPNLPIIEFQLEQCKQFQSWLEKQGKAPRTINNHILTLRTLWGESSIAKKAGVVNYVNFQNAGYLGMYNMKSWQLEKLRGIKKGKLMDNMGRTELAANLFRLTQTEERIKNKGITGQQNLEQTHYAVGKEVRKIIQENAGKSPENLPQEKQLPDLKKELKQGYRNMQKEDKSKKVIKKKKE